MKSFVQYLTEAKLKEYVAAITTHVEGKPHMWYSKFGKTHNDLLMSMHPEHEKAINNGHGEFGFYHKATNTFHKGLSYNDHGTNRWIAAEHTKKKTMHNVDVKSDVEHHT